ncbi:DinB family protein [Sinomicrobium weinanense]|uniref:DinB family protein n=1 Tax=Sinomicrobium weinanense TaxID=2842200 RepID=A0A926JV16_9FLAO|nr:DinB family protein [Sinomicrobium weinanense]MBC9797834.1 DinB family protein [Sinomicrobium weinanense]MBU3124669.1 DinB family protein [Sinomicrobium weinanense]
MKMQLLAQFDLHHRLYNNVLEDLTDEETNKRINGNTQMNHIKYLAGHLLNAQYGLAFLSGVPVEVKWDDLFAGPGKTKAKDNFPYPDIEDIKKEWNDIHHEIRNGLSQLSPDMLDNLPPAPLNNVIENSPLKGLFNNSVAGLWAFFNHHQAYHIGQIGILRRGLGKPAMHYNETGIYSSENK